MTSPERLKGIDAFVATADSGGFTAAAGRLKITNSAVSKSVARLEQRLGVRLFNRTTRTLSLTDAGTIFYRTCTKILADLEEAEAVMGAERLEPVGKLRIDLPASYGRLHVLPLLLQFVTDYPGVKPYITFSDHFVDLVEEDIDLVVRFGGPDVLPAALGHRHLASEKLIFCASPAYLERKGQVVSLADLDRHELIVFKKSDGPISWLFKDTVDGPTTKRIVDGRIAFGNAEAEVAAVVAGCGIAQLPTWLVGHELQSGEIVEVLPGHSTAGQQLSIQWQKSRQALPKISLLIDLLAAGLR